MQALGSNLIEFGEFRLDAEKKILWRGEAVVSLPLKSIELLCVLIERPGEVVGKDALIERVWKDSFVEESVLTQNIYLLRKTLQTKGDGKNLIKNVPRRGYLFGGEVRELRLDAPAPANGSNGAATIIERHLFEKIEYEETDGAPDSVIEKSVAPLEIKTQISPQRIYQIAFAGLLLLTIITVAAFYFRGDSRPSAVSSPSPIKLKSVVSPSAVKTLAILPLRIHDEKEKSFAESFAGDLSVRLGSTNKFAVVPFALVQERGRTNAELKVDYVLDGEVSAVNNFYAATLRLLDVKTGAEVWTGKFADANLIRLEDAISNKTAQAVTNQLTAQERETISKRLPTNLAAYENFQTGYALWRRREDGRRSAYFKRAIEADASFARAYVALAGAEAMDGAKDLAEANLNKAFELDDNSADAYAVQGFIRIFYYSDWTGAEASLKNALALDANNVNAHHWLAVFYSIHRRLDEAKAEMQIALELDPTNPTLLGDLAQLHYFAGDKDSAVRYCETALEFAPNHIFAAQYLNSINQPPTVLDKESTLNQLSQADRNIFAAAYINVDPRYDALRDDARFQEILQKIKLNR